MKVSSKPIRIQRKRVKGWRMPENAISVTRPGKWGNPFSVGDFVRLGNGKRQGEFGFMKCREKKYANSPDYIFINDVAKAVEVFREYRERYPLNEREIDQLKGYDLACWCKIGDPCHAEILLEIANT